MIIDNWSLTIILWLSGFTAGIGFGWLAYWLLHSRKHPKSA